MPTTTKNGKKVAKRGRVSRIMTPELTTEERAMISRYHQMLKSSGVKVSEGGALLYAAMQTIRQGVPAL